MTSEEKMSVHASVSIEYEVVKHPGAGGGANLESNKLYPKTNHYIVPLASGPSSPLFPGKPTGPFGPGSPSSPCGQLPLI